LVSVEGEYESAIAITKVIPGLVSASWAWGAFRAETSATSFYLSEAELSNPVVAPVQSTHEKKANMDGSNWYGGTLFKS
jgi:hypothetical protein